jgi:hypothetical protein
VEDPDFGHVGLSHSRASRTHDPPRWTNPRIQDPQLRACSRVGCGWSPGRTAAPRSAPSGSGLDRAVFTPLTHGAPSGSAAGRGTRTCRSLPSTSGQVGSRVGY